jgi:hypothetical protein
MLREASERDTQSHVVDTRAPAGIRANSLPIEPGVRPGTGGQAGQIARERASCVRFGRLGGPDRRRRRRK